MIEALIVSNVITWCVILALGIVNLALARQLGVLHERIKPVGALSLGKVIAAGETAPEFNLPSLTGGAVTLGGRTPGARATLLFFLSPTCPVCKVLLPILRAVHEQERRWLRVVLASDGVEAEHLEFIDRFGLRDFPYLLSTHVGMAFQIGKLPYGVLISADGKILSHGLVNNREHLESLFESGAIGTGAMPDSRDAIAGDWRAREPEAVVNH